MLSLNLLHRLLHGLLHGLAAIALWLLAAPLAAESYWQDIAPKTDRGPAHPTLLASPGRLLSLELGPVSHALQQPDGERLIELPLPRGGFTTFALQPIPTLAPPLAASYPQIVTFGGYDIEQPANRGVFDLTPAGFHAMFHYRGRTVFIDPQHRDSDRRYLSYYKKDARPLSRVPRLAPQLKPGGERQLKPGLHRQSRAGRTNLNTSLTTYRIAISTSGEYSRFHGGSYRQVLGSLVTLLNRINYIFERDLAVRLVLAADNERVIFLDPHRDPFANDNSDHLTNAQVQRQYLGIDAFDLGHVLNTNPGGLATLAAVCDNRYKSNAVTGSRTPTSDSFYLDLIAHELGHQFGAYHSFNGTSGNCEENRRAHSAFEPGSGSTLMGYSGQCADENIQHHNFAFFHAHSIDQISGYLATTACGERGLQPNHPPEVTAQAKVTIPARTPFLLTGSARDPDGDPLSYIWEQFDLGNSSSSRQTMTDDGSRPIFRSWRPGPTPERYLPRLEDLLRDALAPGEAYPTTSRELNFRLTVRDGRGGLGQERTTLRVDRHSGPFRITEPSEPTLWLGESPQRIEWEVARTDVAPVSCPKVSIALSQDGGHHFDHWLLRHTDNDGQAHIALPPLSATRARVRVSCDNNVFFAISSGDIEIVHPAPVIIGQRPLEMMEESELRIELSQLKVKDIDSSFPGHFNLRLLPGEGYQVADQYIRPVADLEGELTVPVQIFDGRYHSNVFPLKIRVLGVNDPPRALDDHYTLAFNRRVNLLDVTANDTDIDIGDELSLDSVTYRGSGQLSIGNNQLRYTPARHFSGRETFSYTLSDRAGLTSNARVTVTVTPNSRGGGALYWVAVIVLVAGYRHRSPCGPMPANRR